MVTDRVFSRPYTAEELDRGVGMRYHPCHVKTPTGGWDTEGCTAVSVACLKYDRKKRILFIPSFGCYGIPTYLPRIGIGKNVQPGDPYPAHWCVDPFTGEFIPSTFVSAQE